MKLLKLVWPLVALSLFLGSYEVAGSETTAEATELASSTPAVATDPRCEAEGLSAHQRDTCLAVSAAFPDAPGMVEVARCESTLRQLKDGAPLVSPTNDIGALQINRAAHAATAARLGIDITTIDGNLAYARILYDRSGYRDWYMSGHCHGLS